MEKKKQPSLFWLLVRLIPLLALAVSCVSGVVYLFMTLPGLEGQGGLKRLQLQSMDDIKAFVRLLQQYSETNYSHVFFLYSSFYLTKQMFSIPGSTALNVIAGALYGLFGFLLVCTLTALGATGCYLLSKFFGGPLIERWFLAESESVDVKSKGKGKGRLSKLRIQIERERRKGDLFFYLLFMRLFPFTPNWLLNIVSPYLSVPIHLFSASIFLGLLPYNFITTQAGSMLSTINSTSDIFQTAQMVKLAGIAAMALVPLFIKKKFGNKVTELEENEKEQ
ncbi:snare associated Golgi protein-domain-containing protein [Paraphysoderma sedebokerense]|nr:snare associated Golgi protein-domain-containing protein [Paraphysoderma sedebokerense]